MDCADIILDLGDYLVDIVHNNVLQISNVVMYILIMDIHKLLP